MKKTKDFWPLVGICAFLSFVCYIIFLIIGALIVNIFGLNNEESIKWMFIYIPLLAAAITFFFMDVQDESFTVFLWLLTIPLGVFMMSRPYGSVTAYLVSNDTNFYLGVLNLCLISFVFTLVLSLIIPRWVLSDDNSTPSSPPQINPAPICPSDNLITESLESLYGNFFNAVDKMREPNGDGSLYIKKNDDGSTLTLYGHYCNYMSIDCSSRMGWMLSCPGMKMNGTDDESRDSFSYQLNKVACTDNDFNLSLMIKMLTEKVPGAVVTNSESENNRCAILFRT